MLRLREIALSETSELWRVHSVDTDSEPAQIVDHGRQFAIAIAGNQGL
jgi:hypothetical protein